MISGWHFYVLAITAVILLGLPKGGFAGIGARSLPLLALAIDPVRTAAIKHQCLTPMVMHSGP